MLESIAYIAMVISCGVSVLMFCMLGVGEMAIALGAHVPGHRKFGKVFLWTVGFTLVTVIVLVIAKSNGL